MKSKAPVEGGRSPWGSIQSVEEIAEGIVSVTTAGHGGIWLAPALEAKVPAGLRALARQYAPSQWYEEDCDAYIVGFVFADKLEPIKPGFVKYAKAAMGNERYAKASGVPQTETDNLS